MNYSIRFPIHIEVTVTNQKQMGLLMEFLHNRLHDQVDHIPSPFDGMIKGHQKSNFTSVTDSTDNRSTSQEVDEQPK